MMLSTERVARRAGAGSLIVCIVLLAMNLRLPMTVISPLFGFVREDSGLSNATVGFLTTLPLLIFALLSPLVAGFSRQLGREALVCLALLAMLLGSMMRPLGSSFALFTGTFLIGVAIAIGNVILPSVVKQDFPTRLGLMTGLYLISMNMSSAFASAASFPLANSWGWQGSLRLWSLLAALALLSWVFRLRYNRRVLSHRSLGQSVNVWKNPLAWQVTAVMGMQSTIFYVGVAWLPEIAQARGLSPSGAGVTLSLMQFGIMPSTFIVSVLAGRMKNQRSLVTGTTILLLASVLGLIVGRSTGVIFSAAFIYGIGSGAGFSLSMMFFSLRTSSAEEAANLSGMAQAVGYCIAAFNPTLFGVIYQISGSVILAMLIMVLASLGIYVFGMRAGSAGTLSAYGKS